MQNTRITLIAAGLIYSLSVYNIARAEPFPFITKHNAVSTAVVLENIMKEQEAEAVRHLFKLAEAREKAKLKKAEVEAEADLKKYAVEKGIYEDITSAEEYTIGLAWLESGTHLHLNSEVLEAVKKDKKYPNYSPSGYNYKFSETAANVRYMQAFYDYKKEAFVILRKTHRIKGKYEKYKK